jgi:hypothetical protein
MGLLFFDYSGNYFSDQSPPKGGPSSKVLLLYQNTDERQMNNVRLMKSQSLVIIRELIVAISFDEFSWHGLVAQLDRASACGAEGRRFDSCRDHHENLAKQ